MASSTRRSLSGAAVTGRRRETRSNPSLLDLQGKYSSIHTIEDAAIGRTLLSRVVVPVFDSRASFRCSQAFSGSVCVPHVNASTAA